MIGSCSKSQKKCHWIRPKKKNASKITKLAETRPKSQLERHFEPIELWTAPAADYWDKQTQLSWLTDWFFSWWLTGIWGCRATKCGGTLSCTWLGHNHFALKFRGYHRVKPNCVNCTRIIWAPSEEEPEPELPSASGSSVTEGGTAPQWRIQPSSDQSYK